MHKARLGKRIKLGQQIIVKPILIEYYDRRVNIAKLIERKHLHQLFKRANPARQRYKAAAQPLHGGLALMHILCDYHFAAMFKRYARLVQLFGYNANRPAAL